MNDFLIFILLGVAFAAAIGYVRLCLRMVGSRSASTDEAQ